MLPNFVTAVNLFTVTFSLYATAVRWNNLTKLMLHHLRRAKSNDSQLRSHVSNSRPGGQIRPVVDLISARRIISHYYLIWPAGILHTHIPLNPEDFLSSEPDPKHWWICTQDEMPSIWLELASQSSKLSFNGCFLLHFFSCDNRACWVFSLREIVFLKLLYSKCTHKKWLCR